MESGQRQELTVGLSWAGFRADVFLFHELPGVSRTRIRQKVQGGDALLNAHRFSTSTRLRTGDVVVVTWRGAPGPGGGPDLEVLYEDEHLLIVDKPAGVATHPAGGRQTATVVQFARRLLEGRIRASLERGDPSIYPTVVNRLDVHTSGIVVLALSRGVHRAMQAMAGAHRLEKEYIALVEGRVRDDQGLIDLPLGFSQSSAVRLKMACRPDGKESRTGYRVIERLPRHTLVRVFPQTGRQHQIRVHFAAIGHPVAGDLLYKDERLFLAAQEHPRLAARHALHAARVTFTHPSTAAVVDVQAGVPGDLAAMIEAARALEP
jgi:23S rRNA pseudouridine1911/1915/1917 synthase